MRLTDSPFYQQVLADVERQAILDNLDERLGPVPEGVAERLRAVSNIDRLKTLHRWAARADSLDEFLRDSGEK